MAEKKEKKGTGENTCPEWMVTMGDAMSLLVCFFVLLLTFSTKNDAQLMAFIGFMRGALGAAAMESVTGKEAMFKAKALREQGSIAGQGVEEANLIAADKAAPMNLHSIEIRRQVAHLAQRIRLLGFAHSVTLRVLEEGISVQIDPDTLFKNGKLDITEETSDLMDEVSHLILNVANEVRISDCIPESEDTRSAVAWRRSMFQTTSLASFLANKYDIQPSRFGCGTRVLEPGRKVKEFIEVLITPEHRARELTLQEMLEQESSSGGPGNG